jgi:hypothetical protein
MKLLDLFCGAGGASVGYDRAGFTVTGIDNTPHPDYPFEFVQADAMEVLTDTTYLRQFDVIHASPPCKAFTKTGWAVKYGYNGNHADLLTPARQALQEWGGPWIIENVPGAPMRADFMLCGSQFALPLRRHRLFETEPQLFTLMPPCDHSRPVLGSPHGHPHFAGEADLWAEAMDIDWMRADDLAQAIPPAYTEFIGSEIRMAVTG